MRRSKHDAACDAFLRDLAEAIDRADADGGRPLIAILMGMAAYKACRRAFLGIEYTRYQAGQDSFVFRGVSIETDPWVPAGMRRLVRLGDDGTGSVSARLAA